MNEPAQHRKEFLEWLKWSRLLNANMTVSLVLVLLSYRHTWLLFPAGLFVGSGITIYVFWRKTFSEKQSNE